MEERNKNNSKLVTKKIAGAWLQVDPATDKIVFTKKTILGNREIKIAVDIAGDGNTHYNVANSTVIKNNRYLSMDFVEGVFYISHVGEVTSIRRAIDYVLHPKFDREHLKNIKVDRATEGRLTHEERVSPINKNALFTSIVIEKIYNSHKIQSILSKQNPELPITAYGIITNKPLVEGTYEQKTITFLMHQSFYCGVLTVVRALLHTGNFTIDNLKALVNSQIVEPRLHLLDGIAHLEDPFYDNVREEVLNKRAEFNKLAELDNNRRKEEGKLPNPLLSVQDANRLLGTYPQDQTVVYQKHREEK